MVDKGKKGTSVGGRGYPEPYALSPAPSRQSSRDSASLHVP